MTHQIVRVRVRVRAPATRTLTAHSPQTHQSSLMTLIFSLWPRLSLFVQRRCARLMFTRAHYLRQQSTLRKFRVHFGVCFCCFSSMIYISHFSVIIIVAFCSLCVFVISPKFRQFTHASRVSANGTRADRIVFAIAGRHS